jgi:hypothetical protein
MKKYMQVMMIFVLLLSGAGSAVGLALAGPVGPDGAPTLVPGIFLPLIQRFGGYTAVTGQVTDAQNNPLAGVTILDSAGHSTTTDAAGRYQLADVPASSGVAAVKAGYNFAPSIRMLASDGNAGAMNFTAYRAAEELIVNGNFETRNQNNVPGWTQLGSNAYVPVYYNDLLSNHFMRMGTATAPGYAGTSEIRQPVTIPDTATSAILNLVIFPVYGQPPLPVAAQGAAGTEEPTWMEAEEGSAAAADTDVQFIRVMVQDRQTLEFQVLDYLYYQVSNGAAFTPVTFSLLEYAGLDIWLSFGAYNDGSGRAAALFVDNVSVQLDVAAVPGTPAVACDNGLVNSNFENTRGWMIPVTAQPARYSDNQAHKDIRSMQTGITNRSNDKVSWSDAWQTVHIPSDIDHAMLRMWVYTQVDGTVPVASQSEDLVAPEGVPAGFLPGPTLPDEAGNRPESMLAADTQYVLIYNSDRTQLLKTVMWSEYRNKRAWEFVETNLLAYRGQTITVYFGTYNGFDGVGTAMYVDEAIVELCELSAPPATPTATVPATPTIIPTGTGTITPACNIDALVNNGFERSDGWGIPITEFSAGYTTEKERQGAWSMRSGIPWPELNKYSYSDFYQVVSVPDTWDRALVKFWYYPKSTSAAAITGVEQESFSADALDYSNQDLQYLLVLDRYGNWIDTLLWTQSNTKTWTAAEINVSEYRGSTIRLQWGVYNNGYDGVTTMWVDDVELTPCP